MKKTYQFIVLTALLVPIAPIILKARFQTVDKKDSHSLQIKSRCASSCLRKKHCHSFLLGSDSRCSQSTHGCRRRSGESTCFLKIVPCVGQTEYSPSCTREFLLVEDDVHIMHKVIGARIHKMKWSKGKRCDMWSTAYDNYVYYWMCDDGVRLAFAHYSKVAINIKGFLIFRKGKFRWFQVDGNLLFAVKWPESKFMYKFEMSSHSLTRLKKINKNRQSKGFYMDKTKKHIYWLKTFLRRTDYDGKTYKAYKNIRLVTFFMEFQGQIPTVYGFNKRRIVEWKLGARKKKDLGPAKKALEDCEGILRIEGKTLAHLGVQRTRGLWHVEKRRYIWKKIHGYTECVFFDFVGWW